jgi:hypothetical protein
MKTIRLPKEVVEVREVGGEVELDFFGLTSRDEAIIMSVVNNDVDEFDSGIDALLDSINKDDLLKYLKKHYEPEDIVSVDMDPYISWTHRL